MYEKVFLMEKKGNSHKSQKYTNKFLSVPINKHTENIYRPLGKFHSVSRSRLNGENNGRRFATFAIGGFNYPIMFQFRYD